MVKDSNLHHLPPQIAVDSHTHLLPLRLSRSIRAFFDANVELKNSSPPLELDEEGGGCCIVPSPGPMVYSSDPTEAVEEMLGELEEHGEWADQGEPVAVWTLPVGDYGVVDARLRRFWELAEALRLPVVVHAGSSALGTTDVDELDDIATICARHPNLPLILAHAGHPSTSKALELTRHHPNLHLDTTPVVNLPVLKPPHNSSDSHHLLTLATTSRIVFGSDLPNVALKRSVIAQGVREWISDSVVRVMGSYEIEDVSHEMERVCMVAEREVFGGAAIKLEEGVRSVEEAKRELGWEGKARL
ncbi:hypothetical protein MNV49_001174 [Pseudohyphozyma bogoriensis]|nr:hypothetical protein MNV49_001174 [Pseudohyphozyma bogoriensis]